MKTFIAGKTVEADHLDDLQHVNNVQYLQWVQEMAKLHWESVSDPDWKQRFIWVVRSHHIEYFRPALLGDKLELTTFVKESRGPISVRCVDIRMAGQEEKIVSCTTQWCLLDTASLKPIRIPSEISTRF